MFAMVRHNLIRNFEGFSWTKTLRAVAHKLRPYPPATLSNSVLNRMEQAFIQAAADAFFPPAGPIPVSGTTAGVLRYFEGYMERFHGQQRTLLRLLLVFSELSPLLFGPPFIPFTRLSQAHRERFLDQASHSRIYFRRLAFTTLRAVMTMGYLNNDTVAQHIGFSLNTDPFGLGNDVKEQA